MKKIRYVNFILGLGISLALFAAINGYYTMRYIKVGGNVRWPCGAFKYSPLMGYEMTPFFSSKMLDGAFSISSHALGYRIPVYADKSAVKPGGVMSLGCSFTYGDGVEAEETFTWLVAEKLGVAAYNYGLCSSSYATMIMRLKLMEENNALNTLKPRILILGAGNWLVERAASPFIPSGSNMTMVFPYIAKKQGHLQICAPADFFSLKHMFFLESQCFSAGEKNRSGINNFRCFRSMFLLMPRAFLLSIWKATLGKPDIDSYELYDYLIGEIKRIIAPYKTQLVILWMPANEGDAADNGLMKALGAYPDVILVNGAQALKRYGVPASQYSGVHPRFKAHEAYANEILLQLPRELKN